MSHKAAVVAAMPIAGPFTMAISSFGYSMKARIRVSTLARLASMSVSCKALTISFPLLKYSPVPVIIVIETLSLLASSFKRCASLVYILAFMAFFFFGLFILIMRTPFSGLIIFHYPFLHHTSSSN